MPATLSQSVNSFFDYLKFEKRYSPNTLLSYKTDISEFINYLNSQFGIIELKGINHGFIRSWLADLKNNGLSAKSINRKISTLKSFFKYQLKMEEIDVSPMSKVVSPKIGKKLPVFIKESETKVLVELLGKGSEDWKTLNAKMLISIFYATGMRLSELINLKEQQIDFSRSQIKVFGKGNKERVIPVHNNIITSIKEYQQIKRKEFDIIEDILLVTDKGKKMYPKYAYLLVNKYLAEASTLEKKSPHILRHTFATHLMNNGADLNAVKELLGHSSLAATQVYTHNTIEKLKNVHKKAHPKA